MGWFGLVAALLVGTARAEGWWLGGGLDGGCSPFEPSYSGPAGPAPTVGGNAVLAYSYGGKRSSRGRTTLDPMRAGFVFAASYALDRAGFRGHSGGGGIGVARRWGTPALHLAAGAALGFGVYTLAVPVPDPTGTPLVSSTTIGGPWLRPSLTVGIAVARGLLVEVGPHASVIVPLWTEFHNGAPSGRYLGQIGGSASVLVGVR